MTFLLCVNSKAADGQVYFSDSQLLSPKIAYQIIQNLYNSWDSYANTA